MTEAEPAPAPQAGSAATLVDGVNVDAVANAARSCAGVDDLYSTPTASIASYLPGRQVPGVRVQDRAVTVQVRSRWAVPVTDVAAQVTAAVLPLVAGRAVHVMIADITDPPQSAPPALPAAAVDRPDPPPAAAPAPSLPSLPSAPAPGPSAF